MALTHDPKLDDLALIEALKSAAFYVGALGSRSNTAKRKQRLAEFDLSQAELDRLHGPVGLRIGSKTPPEIAVSILAEMTAVRHGVDLGTVGSKESKEVRSRTGRSASAPRAPEPGSRSTLRGSLTAPLFFDRNR